MKRLLLLALACCFSAPAVAQPAPNEATTQLVAQVNETFFDQLTAADFATERAFLSPELSAMLSAEDWAALRQSVIDRTGPTPRFQAHQLTYYSQDTLLAAVDFVGETQSGDFICGYALWSLPTADRIGLSRLEQNIVSPEIMRQLPAAEAAQTLTTWRCPQGLIAAILGIATQD